MTRPRKKLIEVALPLEAINKASAREKSIRHGHPSTLHLWWARRPLAAARAVIFSQMVDDPSEYVDVLKGDAKLLRRAEKELKARHAAWQEATTLKDKADAAGISAPAPGPEPTLEGILAEIERQRLFKIIEDLVQWENTTNEEVLNRAREEIWQSWRRTCAENAGHPRAKELFDRNKLPAFHDPFAGGGALPLEAQRLGLEAYASDLNPVAVLINKAMIEIPPKFAGRPPVSLTQRRQDAKELDLNREWKGAQGLAEDVRYYGQWMRDEAEKRIGHLYPKVKVVREKDGTYRHATAEEIARQAAKTPSGAAGKNLGVSASSRESPAVQELTVIAWLWARTVKSPNPAFRDVDVPLASTFLLSTKPGKEAWVEVVLGAPASSRPLSPSHEAYHFTVKTRASHGAPPPEAKNGTKLARGANFRCVMSGTPIEGDYIKAEGQAGRMGARMMAIVAEGERGRVYLPPTPEHESAAKKAKPEWKPEGAFVEDARAFTPFIYGLGEWQKLFTDRQLVALTTFSDLVGEARKRVCDDALAAELGNDNMSLREGGVGATAYAEAVAVYLAFASSRATDAWSALVSWRNGVEATRGTFGRQALGMVWDFAEASPFSDSCGNWNGACLEWVSRALVVLPGTPSCSALQSDAATQVVSQAKLVSTDPPYFDNVPYADLSDFFYVWLRRSLRTLLPQIFATLAVPKAEELVAFAYRHGGAKSDAEQFFLDGMTRAMRRLSEQAHPAFPVTIYYAFKQAEEDDSAEQVGTSSTGWETFLGAVIRAGFATTGTWPTRTEKPGRMRENDANALASSIVLVCRPRAADAPTATRREFVAALQRELPEALRHLQAGNIAPVDLAQAAIGPGMAVFTRYARVLDAQGNALSVREALALINETLDTALAEQEGDFDPDSRWALAWFDQFGFDEGEYGVALVLATAKNTSVDGLHQAGVVHSKAGKVRLLRPEELAGSAGILPASSRQAGGTPALPAWATVHHLIRALTTSEGTAAALVAKLGAKAETARELAYRLYTLCERKKRAAEALAYNGLVQSWPDLLRQAEDLPPPAAQGELFG